MLSSFFCITSIPFANKSLVDSERTQVKGKYLTYPKIDREPTWNFSLILSIFDFKCKILDQNATINGREIINTSVKV